MNKLHSIAITGFFVIAGNFALHAQQGFDVKKHNKQNINTSSLKAQHIDGSSTSAGGRSVGSNLLVKNSRKLSRQIVKDPGMKVVYSQDTGLPSFITTDRAGNSVGRSGSKSDARVASLDYITELKDVLGIGNPADAFRVTRINAGNDRRTHVRMEQMFQGIPVYGSEVVVHLNELGAGEAFNGKYLKVREDLKVAPGISSTDAVNRVSGDLKQRTRVHALTEFERSLVEHAEPMSTLCVYEDQGMVKTQVLAYHIVYYPSALERWEYFVDASSGSVLHQFESTCGADGPRTATGTDLNGTSRTINTYQVGSAYYMLDATRPMFKTAGSKMPDDPKGGILTVDMNNTHGDNAEIRHVASNNNTWMSATHRAALSAHYNAGVAYEYYRTNYTRNSIDGNGGTIISIVNVVDEEGDAMDNAFWNGKAMFYGNGNVGFKPLAGGVDVAGHEMTHGVIQNTANLEYQGESGAINESMADVFGTMIEPDQANWWLIGEDVVKTSSFPSGALRSLQDPHNGGNAIGQPGYQPAHTNEMYRGTQDNGGVHINSGIPNLAFYKFATATTRKKAADTFYKALDDYLTKSSKFVDLRLAVIKAATDLYGASSNEVTQAGLAFDAVGITNGQGTDNNPTLPGNPGTEFMLLYNVDNADSNTLYRVAADGSSATALTKVQFLSRPSVTDDGSAAVFVGGDHKLYTIITKPGEQPTVSPLQNEPIWSNVVVSKGGTKLAAVTTDQDAMIYVYDFATEDWYSFELYNPTYSEGVTSGGPVYADAIEWDYTGQFLVYDCFNQIKNANGSDIEYWDVNFIQVWDNAGQSAGSGKIEKLFSSLPDGVSVGNPSFAKNSPGVIAFDYVDYNTDEYYILGCNIETNDLNAIVQNNSLGWPSYNINDTRIAYTSEGDNGNDAASYIALGANKISGTGQSAVSFTDAKWPVYFATGERVTGENPEPDPGPVTDVPDATDNTAGIKCYPNPAQSEVFVQTADPRLMGGKIEIFNMMGQRMFDTQGQAADADHLVVQVANLSSGQYVMRVSSGQKTAGCKLYKK